MYLVPWTHWKSSIPHFHELFSFLFLLGDGVDSEAVGAKRTDMVCLYPLRFANSSVRRAFGIYESNAPWALQSSSWPRDEYCD
jgi:hypothetical protein